MTFLAIELSVFEVLVLLLGATILGVTIHFFMVSRRTLNEFIPAKSRQERPATPARAEKPAPLFFGQPTGSPEKDLSSLQERLQQLLRRVQPEEKEPVPVRTAPSGPPPEWSRDELISTLRQTINQQQRSLDEFLGEIERLKDEGKESLIRENGELKATLQRLEATIQKQDDELDGLRHQSEMAQKLNARIGEVYQEFDLLQRKMGQLEEQAADANNLAMELEDMREAYEQVKRDVLRKQEKLEESMADYQRIRQQLNETEDKLAEANLQRQQLQKKVQFLQDHNNELQNITETNKKLQSELRRISELESMLHMISQERDQLLGKQK